MLFQVNSFGQLASVEVAELTLKIGGMKTEEIYYGFAEGDQIEFSFEEVKGKTFKEIEIVELPENSKFMDYKCKSSSKKLAVHKKGVYKFSFRNSAITGRICRIHIKRIPKDESTKIFNTEWKWNTIYDTTYTPYVEDSLVGYDTTYFDVIKQRLIKDELVLQDVLKNHAVKVHSRYYGYELLKNNVGQYNEEVVAISLPLTIKTKYKRVENVAWYYGVGINQELRRKANKTKSNLMGAAGSLASIIAGPEMKVAFTLFDNATTNNSDLSIETGLMADYNNVQLFMTDNPNCKALRWDNIVSSSSIRMNSPLRGKVYLGLENHNGTSMITGGTKPVTVYVNVSAWTRTREYENYTETQQNVEPRYVKLNKTRMDVKSTKVRVCAG